MFPDASIDVRTPIVVPADALLPTVILLIVIAMSLSALNTNTIMPLTMSAAIFA
jgi:hypothetical protein